MSDMVRARVSRVNIQAKLAEGYTFVRGDSPDGKAWIGDTVLMEIPRDRYEKLQAQRREGYEQLQRAISSGNLPLTVDEPGVSVSFSVSDGREVELPRRRSRKEE